MLCRTLGKTSSHRILCRRYISNTAMFRSTIISVDKETKWQRNIPWQTFGDKWSCRARKISFQFIYIFLCSCEKKKKKKKKKKIAQSILFSSLFFMKSYFQCEGSWIWTFKQGIYIYVGLYIYFWTLENATFCLICHSISFSEKKTDITKNWCETLCKKHIQLSD